MRNVSAFMKSAMMAEASDDEVALLITVTHAALASPLYASSSAAVCFSTDPLLYGLTSRGQQYSYLPMQLALPEDDDGTPPSLEIRVINVGSELTQLLKLSNAPALVTVEVVCVDRPDLVEAVFPDFELGSAEDDEQEIVLTVGLDALMSEPYPADSFIPATYPGLF